MNNDSYHNLCNMFSHMCNYNSDFYNWIVETRENGEKIATKGRNNKYIPADTMKKILRQYGIRSWNVSYNTYESLFRPERRTMAFFKLKDYEKELDKVISSVWMDDKTLFFMNVNDGYYYTITAETEREVVMRCYTNFNEEEDCCENCVAIEIIEEYKDILNFAHLYIAR